MFGWKVFAGLSAIFVGSHAYAQSTARPTDPVFVRAQALVSDGNGPAGRALIDSMIAATPVSAPLYPQALFWRASLAASAADAESDYKHIVVDYPITPQAPDALLRLAQLELARGDRDAALGHLQRVPRDYPHSKSLARANYWIARVLFEKNDLVNGCAANASAFAQLDTSEIELRNQIQYQGQRCPPAGVPVVASQPQSAAGDSIQKSVEAKRPTPPAEANDAKPSIVDPTKSPAAKTEQTAAKESPVVVKQPEVKESPVTARSSQAVKTEAAKTEAVYGSNAKSEYSVQVAAYKTRGDADKLAEGLRQRGYEARVDASADWFRVRVGRYPTERVAETQLRDMKAKQMSGFVVRAPDR
jgi:cell division septation protein DedD